MNEYEFWAGCALVALLTIIALYVLSHADQ